MRREAAALRSDGKVLLVAQSRRAVSLLRSDAWRPIADQTGTLVLSARSAF